MKTVVRFTRSNRHHLIRVLFNEEWVKFDCAFGSSDDVFVAYADRTFFILSYNMRLGYMGLQEFALDGELKGEVFFQNTEELELPKDAFDYTELNMIKNLSRYIA